MKVGLGSQQATINIFIQNIPPLAQYQNLTQITPLQAGEIAFIGQTTGNHWRKIFNVLAKLAFKLNPQGYATWQDLREDNLLQQGDDYALLFSAPKLNQPIESTKVINIVMGKTYAAQLSIAEHAYWLDPYFAIAEQDNLIICPYFDYRQLSDIKIERLSQLILQLKKR